jgi:hypothetical protein
VTADLQHLVQMHMKYNGHNHWLFYAATPPLYLIPCHTYLLGYGPTRLSPLEREIIMACECETKATATLLDDRLGGSLIIWLAGCLSDWLRGWLDDQLAALLTASVADVRGLRTAPVACTWHRRLHAASRIQCGLGPRLT